MTSSRVENDQVNRRKIDGLRDGKGSATIRLFDFGGAALPAKFIIYELPPGASEGVHFHLADDANGAGPYDEFYYIVSGRGRMTLDGEQFAVKEGDYVHAPLGVARGIENIDDQATLKVHLTFIRR